MTDQYPLSTRGKPTARTYGTHDPELSLALVWHTTETGSWPGYQLGLTAPHHSYKALTREWRWHGPAVDERVGTMRSSKATGTPANEKAYQVEIIAYSNRSIAAMSSGWLWVGDFTDDHYGDLADFAAWLATVITIDMGQVTPTPPGGWKSGSGSPLRLDRDAWLAFDGMTAHGAVTGQKHWDTGVLDLQRISDLSTLEDDMFPKRGDTSPTVLAYQYLLMALGYEFNPPAELFGGTMRDALRDLGRRLGLDFDGEEVGPKEYAALHAGPAAIPHDHPMPASRTGTS